MSKGIERIASLATGTSDGMVTSRYRLLSIRYSNVKRTLGTMLERVGLISDTHGLLRPEAAAALAGCSRILHAGDVGSREVLDGLSRVAPVTAVRGNNDHGRWAAGLPYTAAITMDNSRIFMVHDLKKLDLTRLSEKVNVVVSGHSHKPAIERKKGILFVNPGSAGPRRFSLPVAVGFLTISGRGVRASIRRLAI